MFQDANFTQTLGIDLIKAAKNELEFLKLVDEYPNLCKGSVVKNAIKRYERLWLPFASRVSTVTALAAPLDIAWVWHVHMLAPYHYGRDCLNIITRVLDHSPLDSTQRNLALQRTKDLWYTEYTREPFEVDLTKPSTVFTQNTIPEFSTTWNRLVTVSSSFITKFLCPTTMMIYFSRVLWSVMSITFNFRSYTQTYPWFHVMMSTLFGTPINFTP